MFKVLVFPAGSSIGLELFKHFAYSNEFKVFGGTSVFDHGNYVFENLISGFPFINDVGYLAYLNDVIKKYGIDFIFPTSEITTFLFSRWADDGLISQAKVITSPHETCRILRSKQEIHNLFEKYVLMAKRYDSTDNIETYPVFLKPDEGTGGLGNYIANSKSEVNFYLSRDPTLIIMKFLPGNEYTVDCLTDRFGQLRFVGPRLKSRYYTRHHFGHCEKVNADRFTALAEKINRSLELRGPWFCQFKEDQDGNLNLLEVAARISGSSTYQLTKGVNIPQLAIYDFIERDIEIHENSYKLEMDRSLYFNRYSIDYKFDHVYLRIKDTLVQDGRLNHKLMAMLYKIHSEDIPISLLFFSFDPSLQDFENMFVQHNIPLEIFTRTHHLELEIVDQNLFDSTFPIYVDSSFEMRAYVKQKTRIPVMDANRFCKLYL